MQGPATLGHPLLAVLAAILAVYLGSLGWSCRRGSGPRWLRLTLSGTLLLLALDVQLAALLLLAGPDGTQDGLLRGDLRLRNTLGLGATAAVWAAAVLAWAMPRRTARRVLHSTEPSS